MSWEVFFSGVWCGFNGFCQSDPSSRFDVKRRKRQINHPQPELSLWITSDSSLADRFRWLRTDIRSEIVSSNPDSRFSFSLLDSVGEILKSGVWNGSRPLLLLAVSLRRLLCACGFGPPDLHDLRQNGRFVAGEHSCRPACSGPNDRGSSGDSGGAVRPRRATETRTPAAPRAAASGNRAPVSLTPGTEAELKALTYSVLKKIKEKQLEVLLQAVESRGGARSPCLLLPGKAGRQAGSAVVPAAAAALQGVPVAGPPAFLGIKETLLLWILRENHPGSRVLQPASYEQTVRARYDRLSSHRSTAVFQK